MLLLSGQATHVFTSQKRWCNVTARVAVFIHNVTFRTGRLLFFLLPIRYLVVLNKLEILQPNPVQNIYWVIRSDINPVDLSRYSIQSGLYPEETLIKHHTAVIKPVWISISDPVEFFSKSSPSRILLWIAESVWIAIRNGNGNGLLFHMTQPTSRSTIKAIACSKPTISEH